MPDCRLWKSPANTKRVKSLRLTLENEWEIVSKDKKIRIEKVDFQRIIRQNRIVNNRAKIQKNLQSSGRLPITHEAFPTA